MMRLRYSHSKYDTTGVNRFAMSLIFGTLFISSIVCADWKSDANERIEKIRKRDAQIQVIDSKGKSVPNLAVKIEQTKHRFAFGSALAYEPLKTNSKYREFVLEHFEWAICENAAKWQTQEEIRDVEDYSQSDFMYEWCASNGITMRGHTLLWEQKNKVQDWLKELSHAPYPEPSELLDEVNERIDNTVARYKGKFVHWDVNNEILPNNSGHGFYNRLGEAGRVHMFKRAHQADPDCKLQMNEYSGNSFGGYDSKPYRDRAKKFISMGAPIHGLGIQGHLAGNFDPEKYYSDVLNPLAELGLPVYVTEFDVRHGNVSHRANEIENFYRLCFSHPAVEGIFMWGFWQDSMWRAGGHIVDSDWTVNEAGKRYEALLDAWTTNESGKIDAAGKIGFRGFHGTYTVTLTAPGKDPETHTIVLEPGKTSAEFKIKTAL